LGGNQTGEIKYSWDFLDQQTSEAEYWRDLPDSFIRIIEIVGKIVLSLVIVGFAFLIGMLIEVLRQRTPETTAGIKQLSQKKPVRNWLLITSIIGMVLGTMMVVLIVVHVIWLIWEFVFGSEPAAFYCSSRPVIAIAN